MIRRNVESGNNATRKNSFANQSRQTTVDSTVSTGSASEWHGASQTMIIFDWDDTLCPSTWIRNNRPALSYFRPPPQEERFTKPLEEFQSVVCEILETALQMGKVIIVTNAKEPWVTTSCINFMPKVLPFLEKIPIVYAQSIWESCGADRSIVINGETKVTSGPKAGRRSAGAIPVPKATPPVRSMAPAERLNLFKRPHSFYGSSPQARSKVRSLSSKLFSQEMMLNSPNDMCLMWKELSFGIEISEFYSRYENQSWKNTISIGDAEYERTAAKRVFEALSPPGKKKMRLKTLKMMEEPTIYEIISQAKKTLEALPKILKYDGKLDLEID